MVKLLKGGAGGPVAGEAHCEASTTVADDNAMPPAINTLEAKERETALREKSLEAGGARQHYMVSVLDRESGPVVGTEAAKHSSPYG